MYDDHLAHIAGLERKFGTDSAEVATALHTLAMLICQAAKPTVAIPYFERSLRIGEALRGPASLLPQLDEWIGHRHSGGFKLLEPFLLKRLEIKAAAFGDVGPEVANECNDIAARYLARKEPSNALPFLERSLAIKTELYGAESAEVAAALEQLVGVCLSSEEQELADRYCGRCLDVHETVFGGESQQTATMLVELGVVYIAASKQVRSSVEAEHRRKAKVMFDTALTINETLFEQDSLQVQKTLESVARAYLDCRDFREAMPPLERLLDIFERVYGNDSAALLWILAALAEAYAHDGSYKAEPMLERCFAVLRTFLDAKRPTLASRIEELPGNKKALYSHGYGLLEKLVGISRSIHFSTRKRWG
ncbi:MAG: tetratricopeptide repeat protein [Rhizobiales bacterium]|nr:tetratricopeptide repeat protein [Hyphomicrobiales bacterium]